MRAHTRTPKNIQVKYETEKRDIEEKHNGVYVCACVCARERERARKRGESEVERKRERERERL